MNDSSPARSHSFSSLRVLSELRNNLESLQASGLLRAWLTGDHLLPQLYIEHHYNSVSKIDNTQLCDLRHSTVARDSQQANLVWEFVGME